MAEENRPEQSGEEQQPDFSKRHPLEHKCAYTTATGTAGCLLLAAVQLVARQAAQRTLGSRTYWHVTMGSGVLLRQ
jgi:hypothetical protein